MTYEKVKKSFLISNEINEILKKISKELHVSQSRIIEEAILEFEKKRKMEKRKEAIKYIKKNPIRLDIDSEKLKIFQELKGNMDV